MSESRVWSSSPLFLLWLNSQEFSSSCMSSNSRTVGGRGWSVLAKPRFSYRNVKRHRGFPAVQAMLVVWLRLALTTVGNSATEVRYCIIDRGWHTALSVMQLVIARK